MVTERFMISKHSPSFLKKETRLTPAQPSSVWFPVSNWTGGLQMPSGPLTAPRHALHRVSMRYIGKLLDQPPCTRDGVLLEPEGTQAAGHIPGWAPTPMQRIWLQGGPLPLRNYNSAKWRSQECNYPIYILEKFKNCQKIKHSSHTNSKFYIGL